MSFVDTIRNFTMSHEPVIRQIQPDSPPPRRMAAPLPESTIPAAELLAARLAALSRLQAAEAEVNARVEADPEATRPADMFSQPALKRFLEQQAKDAVTALSEATIGSELSIL